MPKQITREQAIQMVANTQYEILMDLSVEEHKQKLIEGIPAIGRMTNEELQAKLNIQLEDATIAESGVISDTQQMALIQYYLEHQYKHLAEIVDYDVLCENIDQILYNDFQIEDKDLSCTIADCFTNVEKPLRYDKEFVETLVNINNTLIGIGLQPQYSFEFESQLITDPFVDPQGIDEVDPLEYYKEVFTGSVFYRAQ